MNTEKRSSSVIVALIAALLIPRIQKALNVTLTIDDIAALMAAAVTVAHGVSAVFQRYFPPPSAKATATPFVQPPSEKSI